MECFGQQLGLIKHYSHLAEKYKELLPLEFSGLPVPDPELLATVDAGQDLVNKEFSCIIACFLPLYLPISTEVYCWLRSRDAFHHATPDHMIRLPM